MLSVGLFFYQLPFMTLGEMAEQPLHQRRALSDGAPPFSDLLTFDRFLHRTGLVEKQATAFFSHPLFFEIQRAAILAEIDHARLVALQWMKRAQAANGHETHGNPDDKEVLAAADFPMVWAFGGSSTGDVRVVSPLQLPIPTLTSCLLLAGFGVPD